MTAQGEPDRVLSESIDAVKMSKQAGWGIMTSRSGETEDTYIEDIAVGLCTGQIKTGAPWSVGATAKAKCQTVGDDLTVTNVAKRYAPSTKTGARRRGWATRRLLLKVNQIGSLSESIDAGR